VLTTSHTSETVLSHLSERSILHGPNLASYRPFAVGRRERRATCSGVAWFRGYHLAVVNLYGQHLRVYRFHPGGDLIGEAPWLELLQETNEDLSYPEDVAVSPDGNLVAVTHSMSEDFGVSLRAIDPVSLAPNPVGDIIRRGSAFHGVNFSPDSRHLAFTEIGPTGYIEVLSVASDLRERTCLLENQYAPLKPKSVAFSHDKRFVVVGLSLNASQKAGNAVSDAMLSVHHFDAANGVIDSKAVAELRDVGILPWNVEMCAFLPNFSGLPYLILAANQAADVVAVFEFNADDRTLTFSGVLQDGLSFPHGVDVSADGKFVAVTNYGDDNLRIVRVTPCSDHAT